MPVFRMTKSLVSHHSTSSSASSSLRLSLDQTSERKLKSPAITDLGSALSHLLSSSCLRPSSSLFLTGGPVYIGNSNAILLVAITMAALIEKWTKLEVRSAIRFLHAKGTHLTEIHCELVAVYGEHVLSRNKYRYGAVHSQEGHTNLQDKPREGHRSSSLTTDDKHCAH